MAEQAVCIRYTLRDAVNSGPDSEHPILSQHSRLSAAIDALIERRHVQPFLGLFTYIYDEESASRMPSTAYISLGAWVPLRDDDDEDSRD